MSFLELLLLLDPSVVLHLLFKFLFFFDSQTGDEEIRLVLVRFFFHFGLWQEVADAERARLERKAFCFLVFNCARGCQLQRGKQDTNLVEERAFNHTLLGPHQLSVIVNLGWHDPLLEQEFGFMFVLKHLLVPQLSGLVEAEELMAHPLLEVRVIAAGVLILRRVKDTGLDVFIGEQHAFGQVRGE